MLQTRDYVIGSESGANRYPKRKTVGSHDDFGRNGRYSSLAKERSRIVDDERAYLHQKQRLTKSRNRSRSSFSEEETDDESAYLRRYVQTIRGRSRTRKNLRNPSRTPIKSRSRTLKRRSSMSPEHSRAPRRKESRERYSVIKKGRSKVRDEDLLKRLGRRSSKNLLRKYEKEARQEEAIKHSPRARSKARSEYISSTRPRNFRSKSFRPQSPIRSHSRAQIYGNDKEERVKRQLKKLKELERVEKLKMLKRRAKEKSREERRTREFKEKEQFPESESDDERRKVKNRVLPKEEPGLLSSMVNAISGYLNIHTDDEYEQGYQSYNSSLDTAEFSNDAAKVDRRARRNLKREQRKKEERRRIARSKSRKRSYYSDEDSTVCDYIDGYAEKEFKRKKELQRLRDIKERAKLKAERARLHKAKQYKLLKKVSDEKKSLEKRHSLLEEKLRRQKEKEIILKIQREEEKLHEMEKEEKLRNKLERERQRLKQLQEVAYGNSAKNIVRSKSKNDYYENEIGEEHEEQKHPHQQRSRARSRSKSVLSKRDKELLLLEKAEKLRKKYRLSDRTSSTPQKESSHVELEALNEDEETKLRRYIEEKKKILEKKKEKKLRELEAEDARKRVRSSSKSARSLSKVRQDPSDIRSSRSKTHRKRSSVRSRSRSLKDLRR